MRASRTVINEGMLILEKMGMVAVNADTVIKNTRSQHVLEKVGLQYIREADGFKYYRYVR